MPAISGSLKADAAWMSALAAACGVANALAPGGGAAAVAGFAAGFGIDVCENITGAPNRRSASVVTARRGVAVDRTEAEVSSGFIMFVTSVARRRRSVRAIRLH